ncbi:hypothetical protein LIER_17910 [Lithospermum erythrorhizon]|uniref:Uncharacterized protein n=1 Tax=Lithospermum erythrorhizon TaxID=34254 RepID=A0AAV3QEJ8_LITER
MQSYILSYIAEEIGSQSLEKDRGLNGDASLNHMDLVQKLNKNVSDAEDIGSVTFTGLVTVAGYRVKREVAPLLRVIISEYGDIASECILQTSDYRASLLESVCMIYQELEPKFPNVTSIKVDNMQARIKDLEAIRLNVKCLHKRLEEFSTLKTLFEKTRSLNEARARCVESIERKEKNLEALEQEFIALQQKISSEKAELALLKTEAETIEASFETMVKMETLPEQFMVPMSTTSGQVKLRGPMLCGEIAERNDEHVHSETTLHNNNEFTTETNEQLIENGYLPPETESIGYEISSDDMNNTNIPGCNYRPSESPSDRGTPNQGSNFAESSRKRDRGKSMNRHGWGTGKKMILQLNEHNQVIGNLAAPFATQLGVISRDGKKFPLTYTDWRAVPEVYKEKIWQEVKENTNLQDDCKKIILGKIAKNWRSWKSTVKELYLIPYFNDSEKLARHPPDDRVEKDQWPVLVSYWKSKAALEVSKQNKINSNSKRIHRSGRMGFAILKEKLKERGIDGDTDLSSFERVKQSPVEYHAGEEVQLNLTKERQIKNEELEPERSSQVQPSTPEMTPSKVLTGTKMKLTESQNKVPNGDSSSAEVGSFRKRKKMQ